ncbi:MAG: N-acetylmuramic acid 6-phosphate etherase [Roseibium sp.]
MAAKNLATELNSSNGIFLEELADSQMFDVLLNNQNRAFEAVRTASNSILAAIDAIAGRLAHPTARLIYCGAGTSGRLALLDAVELDPTFSWPHERMHVLLAGGQDSFVTAQEGAEDDRDAGEAALRALNPSPQDVFIGLAASGTTPFVLSAMETANKAGCLTIGISNNDRTSVLTSASLPVLLETGPEVLAGSTRLAAGSSQKIALNIISTAVMAKLGRVYRGRMVDMRVTNAKLKNRAIRIVEDIAGCDPETAAKVLGQTNYDIKLAILTAKGADLAKAATVLDSEHRDLRKALKHLGLSED